MSSEIQEKYGYVCEECESPDRVTLTAACIIPNAYDCEVCGAPGSAVAIQLLRDWELHINRNVKTLILNQVVDLVANFMYYDRNEDEDLRVGDIEKAIQDGKITIDEIADKFKQELSERLAN